MRESGSPALGIRPNLGQFSLLVLINGLVGAMIGMERSILPEIGEKYFNLSAHTALLSFIMVFGVAKGLTNYFAGHLSDWLGRKGSLVAGWMIGIPVPFFLMVAPSWGWVLVANALLGINQGLTWSTTVIMKIDLAGPERRGLAMGWNEFAGYLAVGATAYATAWIAARYGLRPQPFYLGIGIVFAGLILSAVWVKETHGHARHEATGTKTGAFPAQLNKRGIFLKTSFTNANLSSVTQAGLVNNLNDGMAWGLFPLFFAAAGMDLRQIGILAAVYPAVWGVGQILTGPMSDRWGRKWLIASGMWVQGGGILFLLVKNGFGNFLTGSILLGVGTAMVYPTLLAAIGDSAHPTWRASAVGVYRLWRDLGYALGAALSGILADALGTGAAIACIGGLTLVSGIVVAVRMREVRRPSVA